ncbi:glycosyl hydrolase [Hymenobacter sp. YC55]|uniref:glycosyl hydrolase n=1 Tax=Hymenobacter sp. YC55 TaxID=3034019 RepID=UPI0023F99BE3|nr:glycosyl hydrolase [Hymenobacter sp. YC55]MDF7814798.1 glycosyl hydrolase [Hymenobacter sp. YC55]
MHSKHSKLLVAAGLLLGGLTTCQKLPAPTASVATTPVASPWPTVTTQTRPWVRWWWMGSAVDAKNLRLQLTQFKDVGLGGAEITPIYGAVGYEQQYIDYLSPTWLKMLSTTTRTADSLGLGVDMNVGTGWPYGGPQITPEQAASKLVVQKYSLSAGQRLKEKLALQDPKQLRAAPLVALTAYGSKGERLDLRSKVATDGTLNWQPTAGTWELYAAFGGNTRQMVKRAAPGGAGLVLDHLSQEALKTYLNRFDQAFAGQPTGVRSFFNDSYEVFEADFTPRLLDEFQKRRGYDVRPYLRELVSKSTTDEAARLRDDYRETMAELVQENFVTPWTAWIHGKKGLSRNQSHGFPGNLLDLYATVDIPECETFGITRFPIPDIRYYSEEAAYTNPPPDLVMLKFASSAGHVLGKPLVSSETFTWLGEHFKVPLSNCKPEVEQVFLAGVNHVFYHGTTYSPAEAPWPGWLFYASTNFAPSNSWWPHLTGLNDYITRCQSVLQAGRPESDVLLYWPVYDVRHYAPPTKLDMMVSIHTIDQWLQPTAFYPDAQQLIKSGYAVDFVSDKLLQQSQVSGGRLQVAPQGAIYQALVVPKADFMPVETLENIVQRAQQGATVIIQEMPNDVPGFHQLENRRQRLRSIVAGLNFSTVSAGVQLAKVGSGQILLAPNVQQALDYQKITRETLTDSGLKFIRRAVPDGRYYYLVNHTAKPVNSWVPLNTAASSVLFLDPQTGRSGLAASKSEGNGTSVRLQLQPGEAMIVKTSTGATPGGPAWPYLAPAGPAQSIAGPWSLRFTQGGPELPKAQQLAKLVSWTELPEASATRFSGRAEYTTTFTLPTKPVADYVLKLGDVRESAHVWVNGHDAGLVWSFPYECHLGAYLKKGRNELKIEVANLMANRIIDLDQRKVTWRKYHEINFVNLAYKPFDAASWSWQPSGLLGPVTLTPCAATTF